MIKYRFLFSALVAVISCVNVYSKSDYSIEGYVKNAKGEPLPSVRVYIGHLKKQTFTNIDGNYSLHDIPKGSQTISFSRIGYLKIDSTIAISGNLKIDLIMTESDIISDDVVVTGTRTYKHIEDVAIPTEVITKADIQTQGYTRLDEVLSQQIGLPMTDNRGRGMQMQGLDASYSLILLNGEPITSRMGGIMDISRLSISNVSRVEIVRGPSSSLYGSNALAGVVNLITEKPSKPWSFRGMTRYGTFNTVDLAGEIQHASKDKSYGFVLFGDRYSTDGFSIVPGSIIKTIPRNTNLTLNGEVFYDLSENITIKSGFRNCGEFQDDKYLTSKSELILHEVTNNESNFNININHTLSNRYSHEFRFYASRFKTETDDHNYYTKNPFDHYLFQQSTLKGEFQSTALLGENQIIGGLGYKKDMGESARVSHGDVKMDMVYSYLQDDWQMYNNVNLIASLRYDAHSDYQSNISPKVAMSYKPLTGLTLRAALGTGFKAPDFEQLYLDWENALESYSVYGSKYVNEALKNLQDKGQIVSPQFDLNNIKSLRPEVSRALDFGFSYDYSDFAELRVNVFRNDINDLIDFLLIATTRKAENDPERRVFTYSNINQVGTQGIESRVRFNIFEGFELEVNYQYLQTWDKNVEDQIAKKKIWKRVTTSEGTTDRPVKIDEYGGLFNRSTHSGVAKIIYSDKEIDLNTSIRAVFKGRYGYNDINGNLILDDDKEYAPGYVMYNWTITKKIYKNFSFQAGINNITDYKSIQYQSYNPGRTYYGNIVFNYFIY